MTRSFFLINRLDELKPSQTTSILIAESVRQGFETFVFDIAGLVFADGNSLEVSAAKVTDKDEQTIIAHLALAKTAPTKVKQEDQIFIRTSPGRDKENLENHLTWLDILESLAERGYYVANHPITLRRLISKSYMLRDLGRWMPKGYLSNWSKRPFTSPTVVKPVYGSRGIGIELYQSSQEMPIKDDADLCCFQEVIVDQQKKEHRVLVLNGEVLFEGATIAAYAKVASKGEFRHNLAQGASTAPQSLTPAQLKVLAEIATWCKEQQLQFAGIDLLADKLIEINVFSPGGIDAIEQQSHISFAKTIFDGLKK